VFSDTEKAGMWVSKDMTSISGRHGLWLRGCEMGAHPESEHGARVKDDRLARRQPLVFHVELRQVGKEMEALDHNQLIVADKALEDVGGWGVEEAILQTTAKLDQRKSGEAHAQLLQRSQARDALKATYSVVLQVELRQVDAVVQRLHFNNPIVVQRQHEQPLAVMQRVLCGGQGGWRE
jgi:benzoyl-CoA reductase/2-hydroxyglutaryl-CoA dehydratase subunit BcrC/BadD/HgdB